MKVKDLIIKLQKLEKDGYAEAELCLLDDTSSNWDTIITKGIFSPDEYYDVTIFGSPFNNKTKKVVFVDNDDERNYISNPKFELD